jgi:hypothetical protein
MAKDRGASITKKPAGTVRQANEVNPSPDTAACSDVDVGDAN